MFFFAENRAPPETCPGDAHGSAACSTVTKFQRGKTILKGHIKFPTPNNLSPETYMPPLHQLLDPYLLLNVHVRERVN